MSWDGNCFEVHHHLVGEKVTLVVDPHTQKILRIESAFGDNLGQASPIDRIKNTHRRRQQPHHEERAITKLTESMVETVHQNYINRYSLPIKNEEK